MTLFLQRHFDKVVLFLASSAAAASAGWYWREQGVIRALQREPIRLSLTGSAYVAGKIPGPEAGETLWSIPPAQSRGGGWLFEVFTPPRITFNAATHAFAVPALSSPEEPGASPGGMELVTVRREPYRLQLLGYYGEPNDYVGAFASALGPETLLARPGLRFEALGLTLKSLVLRKVATEDDEYGPRYEVTAQAVMMDERAGTEVVLDNRTRRLTDTLLAELIIPGATAGPREWREGETFADEVASYRIDRIQLDPPEVVVVRTAPGLPGQEMTVLTLLKKGPEKNSSPKSLATRTTSHVAASKP